MLKKIVVASALAMTVASASFAGNPAPSQPEPAPMAGVEAPVVTGSLGMGSATPWLPLLGLAVLVGLSDSSSSTSGT